ncbi:MAG: hypothetical protein ABI641_16250 [Caldimonas sp.]
MQRRLLLLGGLGSLLGCATPNPAGALLTGDTSAMRGMGGAMGVGNIEDMLGKQKLSMDMMSNPDLPAWHAQREKMALAIGDRSFQRPFSRVFDSLTVAMATLGSRVQNMERASGYISGSIPQLEPTRTAAMQDAGMRQYALAKGYPASIFDKKSSGGIMDIDFGGMMARGMAGFTMSLVRQGAKDTKVKLRFDNVYYPELVAEYYKLVWAAVDKQMFFDIALD